jgi:hypothetical protein
MTNRVLISDDGRVRRYRVTNDMGLPIGMDEEAIPTTAEANDSILRDKIMLALSSNAVYLAIANPTTAHNAQQLGRLTRQTSALIRLIMGSVDTTEGT